MRNMTHLYEETLFSDAEILAVRVVPRITGLISVVGSLLIVIDICKRRHQEMLMYHRILFYMSVVDVINSVAFFMGNWPIPPPDGVGTIASCNAQGWFLQFGLSIPIWNALLAVNFLLRIKHEIPESTMRQKEYVFHLIAWIWPLATAFACLGLELYNDALLWCWIAPFPSGCGPTGVNNIPCERGEDFALYQFTLFFGPLWICIVVVCVAMLMIWKHVVQHEKNLEETGLTNVERQSQNVKLQSSFYSAAFIITWFFGSINRIVQAFGHSVFGLVLLHSFFVPLQGFFNYLVYKFPQIRQWLGRQHWFNKCLDCSCRCCLQEDENGESQRSRSNVRRIPEEELGNTQSTEVNDTKLSKQEAVSGKPKEAEIKLELVQT